MSRSIFLSCLLIVTFVGLARGQFCNNVGANNTAIVTFPFQATATTTGQGNNHYYYATSTPLTTYQYTLRVASSEPNATFQIAINYYFSQSGNSCPTAGSTYSAVSVDGEAFYTMRVSTSSYYYAFAIVPTAVGSFTYTVNITYNVVATGSVPVIEFGKWYTLSSLSSSSYMTYVAVQLPGPSVMETIKTMYSYSYGYLRKDFIPSTSNEDVYISLPYSNTATNSSVTHPSSSTAGLWYVGFYSGSMSVRVRFIPPPPFCSNGATATVVELASYTVWSTVASTSGSADPQYFYYYPTHQDQFSVQVTSTDPTASFALVSSYVSNLGGNSCPTASSNTWSNIADQGRASLFVRIPSTGDYYVFGVVPAAGSFSYNISIYYGGSTSGAPVIQLDKWYALGTNGYSSSLTYTAIQFTGDVVFETRNPNSYSVYAYMDKNTYPYTYSSTITPTVAYSGAENYTINRCAVSGGLVGNWYLGIGSSYTTTIEFRFLSVGGAGSVTSVTSYPYSTTSRSIGAGDTHIYDAVIPTYTSDLISIVLTEDGIGGTITMYMGYDSCVSSSNYDYQITTPASGSVAFVLPAIQGSTYGLSIAVVASASKTYSIGISRSSVYYVIDELPVSAAFSYNQPLNFAINGLTGRTTMEIEIRSPSSGTYVYTKRDSLASSSNYDYSNYFSNAGNVSVNACTKNWGDLSGTFYVQAFTYSSSVTFSLRSITKKPAAVCPPPVTSGPITSSSSSSSSSSSGSDPSARCDSYKWYLCETANNECLSTVGGNTTTICNNCFGNYGVCIGKTGCYTGTDEYDRYRSSCTNYCTDVQCIPRSGGGFNAGSVLFSLVQFVTIATIAAALLVMF